MSSHSCSFCGKNQKQVQQLIAGPEVDDKKSYICNECVEFSHKILQQEIQQKEKESAEQIVLQPHIIKQKLDEYLVSQDHAKKIFSVAIYNHYKRINNPVVNNVELQKSNVLMIGSSGTGKTLLVKTIAKILDLPFAIADATALTEAGYVGEDVESVIERLIINAGGDLEKAKKGIVYIDEIDKKVKKTAGGSHQRDISGEGVQQSLLKMVEGDIIRVQGKKTLSEPVDFDTSNVLFITGGAFVGLDKVVRKSRQQGSSIGFGSALKQEDEFDILQKIESKDLIEFGVIPEFVGRFPIVVSLHDLTEDDLVNILTEPKNNLVSQYKALFELDSIKLTIHPDFLHKLARTAIEQKTGARGLRSQLEKILLDTQFDLPTLKHKGVTSVIISADGKPNLVIEDISQEIVG